VEDGTAFCRQCGAPQIRVAGVEPEAIPSSPVSTKDLLPHSLPSTTISGSAIQWSRALPGALIGGFVAAFAMQLPFGLSGLGLLAGGVTAVVLYQRRTFGMPLTGGMGAKLGAFAGAIGFLIFAIFTAVQVAVLNKGAEFRAVLLQALDQAASRSSDPQAQAALAQLRTPEGLAFMMAAGFFMILIVFLILCSVGGALGAVFTRNRAKRY
jgi:hypothetical protein